MLKKVFIALLFLSPAILQAQQDTIVSSVYHWKIPVEKQGKYITTAVLYEGAAHDMEWMQMSSNTLQPSASAINITVPANEEYLCFIRSGRVDLNLRGKQASIGAGSVALLLPGERLSVQNTQTTPADFYLLKYRSKAPMDLDRGQQAGGSFVINWDSIPYKQHDKGGVRKYFEHPTAMGKRLEMHITTLNAGLKSHEPHIHRAEELVLLLNGNTEMQIGKSFYKGQAGSVYYLGSNVPHAIQNEGSTPATYFAFQFE